MKEENKMTVRDLIKLIVTMSPDLDTNVFVLTPSDELEYKNFNIFRMSVDGENKIFIEIKD